MPTLIKGGRVVSDDWTLQEEIADGAIRPHTIVPASYVLAHAELFDEAQDVGIWIPGDGEPGEIATLLPKVALVAIRFPTMNDGRGLSLAVLLRTRFAFTGELRAIGEVHEDVLNYMHRCGIDSYQATGWPRSQGRARRDEFPHRLLSGIRGRPTTRVQADCARREVDSAC
jgi:uncharacterized protein (DUF934 family)